MEHSVISSLTIGTVYCSALIENGSKPATKAEVSKTRVFFSALLVGSSPHSFEKKSASKSMVKVVAETYERSHILGTRDCQANWLRSYKLAIMAINNYKNLLGFFNLDTKVSVCWKNNGTEGAQGAYRRNDKGINARV